jgi:hypothetical protein
MASLNKAQFDSLIKSLKRRGKKLSHDFNVAVMSAIHLYYDPQGYAGNVQCINDILDVARVTKGIRMNGVVEYLKQVIPHEFDAKAKTFGKKLSDTTISQETAENFMDKFPEWYGFTREVATRDFSLEKFLERTERDLERAIKDNKLGETGLVMIKDRLNQWIGEHLLNDDASHSEPESSVESQSTEESSSSDEVVSKEAA